MSSPDLSQSTSVPAIETSVSGTPAWKPAKRALSIDFDSLEDLVRDDEVPEDSIDDIKEETVYNLTRHDSYHQPMKVFPYSGTSKLILHSSSTNSIFHATNFRDLGRSGQKLRDVFAQNPEDAWWLDMQNPSERELRQLGGAFGIHPLTVEDILTREVSEKIEDYPTYRFACFQSFHEVVEEDEVSYEPYTVYMVIFYGGTLSFCWDESGHSAHVEERITKFEDHVSIKSDWVFYAFVDDIVDSFAPIVVKIEKQVNQIDDEVYTTRKEDMKGFLWEIEAIRRQVLSLIRLLGGKSKVLRTFENHHIASDTSDPEILVYINDVQDHVAAMESSLHAFEGILSRSKSSYLGQLEIASLTDRFRVFKLLSRMAVISLILTFMTLISNMFGMNTSAGYALFTQSAAWPWWLIVIGEILFALLLFWLSKKWRMWW